MIMWVSLYTCCNVSKPDRNEFGKFSKKLGELDQLSISLECVAMDDKAKVEKHKECQAKCLEMVKNDPKTGKGPKIKVTMLIMEMERWAASGQKAPSDHGLLHSKPISINLHFCVCVLVHIQCATQIQCKYD